MRFPRDFPISHHPEALADAEQILYAGTLSALDNHLVDYASHWRGQEIIITSKGQDPDTLALPHQLAGRHFLSEKIFLLSGPSFAADLAHNKLVSAVLAGNHLESAATLARHLTSPRLRLYASDDPTGVAIGGAYKNVLAIALGLGHALDVGESARAALITRSLSELQRLIVAADGKPHTCHGLSGLGDLILTASSTQSRNFRLGMALGQGRSPDQALAELGAVAEGYHTAGCLPKILQEYKIEMPICEQVYAILFEGKRPDQALQSLINRPGGKQEHSDAR